MTISSEKIGDTVTVRISGAFTFSDRNAFRKATSGNDGQTRYILDFKRAEHIDSSALGMLLMLREMAGGEQADITLANCGESVSKVIHLANFQRLFKVA